MAKPTGEIVEIPIKSNFKEGLTYHSSFFPATELEKEEPTVLSKRQTPATSQGDWSMWHMT
jgi:hypothetical protein